MTKKLDLYTNGMDTFIAHSAQDAKQQWLNLSGHSEDEDFDNFELLQGTEFSIWDETEDPTDKVTNGRKEWINEIGHGFAWSTEF